MGLTRPFRYVLWTLKQVESPGARAHVQCVSGTPKCGAEPPIRPGKWTPDNAHAWAEDHMRATGHRRYDRVVFDTVQCDPPEGIDPTNLGGVTT
ncbi:hypothetical protein ACFWIA_24715 [Streptomyces sp. NPDC127068]|uniref:DUF7848 domain-containing protein n=1 Tax=Streptomyces sp. NPDC127068 TaxID=3347127 RepID=UPI0036544EBC